MMRLLIYGATPLGAYLAAHFTRLNQQVLWLVDTPTAEAVRRAGLTLLGDREHLHLTHVPLTDSAEEAFAAEYDAICFVMPGYATAPAIREMRQYLKSPPPPIVTLQRGVGNAERIMSVFGADSVIRGALTVVLTHPAIGEGGEVAREAVVRMTDGGIGLANHHRLSDDLAALLSAANLPVTLGNGRDLQWSALLWQLQANAIPALVDLSADDVYNSPSLFAIEYRSLREALRILDALRVRLIDLPDAPINTLAAQLQTIPFGLLASRLVRSYAPPSLRGELLAATGRSEVAYLNGAVAIAAHDLKLSAPVNHALALTFQDIAERRAVWAQFRRSPAMLEALIGAAIGH
jgi:ketopantoate reductase